MTGQDKRTGQDRKIGPVTVSVWLAQVTKKYSVPQVMRQRPGYDIDYRRAVVEFQDAVIHSKRLNDALWQ